MNQTNPGSIQHIYCRDMSVSYVNDPKKRPVSNHISFEVKAGEMMAIMGPSGAGKSTLIKGLLGRAPHITGEIRVNGEDVSKEGLSRMSHRVGLVPQNDVLVDELSMVENIRYFHKIAVDATYSELELEQRIKTALASIGLADDLKESDPDLRLTTKRIGDGSGIRNKISGGQAKRANIAMELVNDPDVLIIDEPTSGLSSEDSLKLISSLKKIAESGKIVILIIHQPSSDIFKQFNKLLILDGCGNCVRSGDTKEVAAWALMNQPNGNGCQYECTCCNSVFPDRVLSAIESKKKSENDRPDWTTESKKFSDDFKEYKELKINDLEKVREKSRVRPYQALLDVSALLKRNALVKMRDKMSFVVTFLAPPMLGWLFATVFRASPEGKDYAFSTNVLFPQFLFMLIVCTMFLGLVNSAVEVIKDRPILEREAVRGLKMWAYYGSKFVTLMGFGLVQVILLAGVALWITQAQHLMLANMAVLLLVMAVSVSIGLLLSSWCDTATKAFNLIPLVLLPQIVLGGAFLSFKDMGAGLYLWEERDIAKQPIVAKVMPATWAYQLAMRVNFDQERGIVGRELNTTLSSLRHIKPGGFLSAAPDRKLVEEPLQRYEISMPREWSYLVKKSYGTDVLVLSLFALAPLMIGWAWVGGRYRVTNTPYLFAYVVGTVAIAGSWLVYGLLTEKAGDNVGGGEPHVPWGYILSPKPEILSDAVRYCRVRGSSIADFETTLSVIRSNRAKLEQYDYWISDESSGKKLGVAGGQREVVPKASGLNGSQLKSLDDESLAPFTVVGNTRAYVAKPSPLEHRRFVCN